MSQDAAWSQKRAKRMVVLMLSACVFGWLYILLPFDEPWSWMLLGIEIALGIVFISLLVGLVRARREDYWREREKDN